MRLGAANNRGDVVDSLPVGDIVNEDRPVDVLTDGNTSFDDEIPTLALASAAVG